MPCYCDDKVAGLTYRERFGGCHYCVKTLTVAQLLKLPQIDDWQRLYLKTDNKQRKLRVRVTSTSVEFLE